MFITLGETKKMIEEGKILHIAAEEQLLQQLPKGKWIGGTTPYFITGEGGTLSKDKLLVEEIDYAIDYKTKTYDAGNIFDVSKDAYENGLTCLIIPFASDVAIHYSKEAPNSEDLLLTPIVGWISGFDLSTGGKAKVFDGVTGTSYEDRAVALHLSLPEDKFASIGTVNIFETDENAPKIEFSNSSLSAKNCLVDGREVNFAEYIAENKIDTQLPLISDYNSVLINVSVKAVSQEDKTVDFYAPVFTGRIYSFAKPVSDYAASFDKHLKALEGSKPVFSCNCILNYLYGELENKSTPPFEGPVTFGEIAYLLLNQTLVYVEITDK